MDTLVRLDHDVEAIGEPVDTQRIPEFPEVRDL
jgi:hypothetical protein